MHQPEKTDMDDVRNVAETLLYQDFIPANPERFGNLFIAHPFTTSSIVSVEIDGEHKLLNLMESEENQKLYRQEMEKAIAQYTTVRELMFFLAKPYRLVALKMLRPALSPKDFGESLALAWPSVEFPSHDVNVSVDEFVELFRSADPQYLMSPKEYKAYQKLPEELTIYRGVDEPNVEFANALSWSNSRKSAIWFATRFQADGWVLRAKVKKQDILAYFCDSHEKEVVVDFHNIKDVKMTKCSREGN